MGGTIASLDEADAVLTETAEIVDRVDAVIGAAWDLRRRIRSTTTTMGKPATWGAGSAAPDRGQAPAAPPNVGR